MSIAEFFEERQSLSKRRHCESVYRHQMFSGVNRSTFVERLLSEFDRLASSALAVAEQCELHRRRDPVRGSVMQIEPRSTLIPQCVELQRSLRLWHLAATGVMRRRTIDTTAFENAFAELTKRVHLPYVAPKNVPAPRTRKAFLEAIAAATLQIKTELARATTGLTASNRTVSPTETLRVIIEPSGERWQVALERHHRTEQRIVTPPLSPDDLEQLLSVELGASSGTVEAATPEILDRLRTYGERLFAALFDVGGAAIFYREARSFANNHSSRLRIHFDLSDESLSRIPWELLHDGRQFLAMSRSISITREGPGACKRQGSETSRPHRVLLVVSSPAGVNKLDRESERQILEEAFAPLTFMGLLQFDTTPDGRMATIHRFVSAALDAGAPYDVLHFAGHGRNNESTGRGTLALTDSKNRAHWSGAVELSSIFNDHPFRCVVLNACHSGEGNQQSWRSAASPFLRAGTETVIGMQLAISHSAAKAFAAEFYAALVDGLSIEDAVIAGRRNIFHTPNFTEWIRPVLLTSCGECS